MQSDQTSAFKATVVVTTKNRRDGLRTTLLSATRQVPPVEIVVIDDGSTDGTHEMVRAEFPQVRILRHERSEGLIVRRNEAAQLATTNIVFSLDDDAEFSSPDVVFQTLREFDDPRVGAVAIPLVDTYRKASQGLNLPNAHDTFVDHIFIGTSHALRVDLFMKLGMYRAFLHHQGEEDDYCIRLLNAGYFVRCGRADPIYHHVSPARDLHKIARYGARNAILFAWQNVPTAFLPIHLAGTAVMNARNGLRTGKLLSTLKGLLIGSRDVLTGPVVRSPVSVRAYRLSRNLRKHGVKSIDECERALSTGRNHSA